MSDHFFGKWLSSPPPGEEVVVTGISGRLPESNNIEEFRTHLFNKDDMVTDDGRRWLLDHPEIPQRCAKIHDIDRFDPGFFGIHHRQTQIMDPMMRKFLETAIEAVMDAGINPSDLEDSNTGVFVGSCYSEMETETLTTVTESQKMPITGYLRSFLAHRLSYFLKLRGPSYNVDTACSSSLNALEHAFRAIRSGQCDRALVGGANLLLHPCVTLQFYRLGVLSKDGKCKVFDQEADGYVRSDSIACIFLQKSAQAKRIYAQIIYSKINCDGFKLQGITFPSSQMQQQLMTEILNDSGLTPSDVSYLEAHGTGTEVGDPEEIEAIDSTIAKKREKPLLVGSVKSSIGHSEPTSGLCSLIKVIIAMETGQIPPNINLNRIKDELKGFHQGRLEAVTEATDLEEEEAVVGINNFGFGGNNCHLMVRRFKKGKVDQGLPDDDVPRLVCVSGRTEEAVLALLTNLTLDAEYIALIHGVFSKNISSHLHRGYSIISKDGIVKSSQKYFDHHQTALYVYFGQFDKDYKILGRYLLSFPVFKETVSRIGSYLVPMKVNIVDSLLKDEDSFITKIAVQIGIVDILKKLGLKPSGVYGEYNGKLISAYYHEVVTLEEVVTTAYRNAKFSEKISYNDFENFKLNPDSFNSKRINRYFNKNQEDSNHNLFSKNFLNQEISTTMLTNKTVLNISDRFLKGRNLLLVENGTVTFLEALGSLYEQGHDLHLHKLYPEIQYPVSRGTPMISPSIKWNYKKSWHTYKFESFRFSDAEQRHVKYSLMMEEDKFLAGHVIDGRNLVPATGYLHMIWDTFIQVNKLAFETPVVFENCKFIKAVTIPKNGIVTLWISIQRSTGQFVVVENDSLVTSGRIYSPSNTNLFATDLDEETDSELDLEQDEIYRELYLRGYNYSGLFKGLVKCNADATRGLVRWENNWVTFIDKMLQMKILQMDTRDLYVPTGIKKLVLNPMEFLASVRQKEECLVPVHINKKLDVVKCRGIEASGLQARSIFRKKSRLEPVLEKYEFIPNNTRLNLPESIRVNVQIILENSLESKFKALEIVDGNTKTESKVLLPLVKEVLEDIPLISTDLTVSSKSPLETVPGIKIDNKLIAENDFLMVIGSGIFQRSTLVSFTNFLDPNGFILTREAKDFVATSHQGLEIITEFVTEDEKLILLRKSHEVNNTKFIELSPDLAWIPHLKNSLLEETNMTVWSQNHELNGIMGFINCIRREPGGNKVRGFFLNGGEPKFDPLDPFYQKQVKKNLAVNVYDGKQWGTYRHLPLVDLEEVEDEYCYVNTTTKGDLSSLKWIQGSLPEESNTTSTVQIYYCALNFKDIMIASGRIGKENFTQNRTMQERLLGFEFSGRDCCGRRVMGMANQAALASRVVCGPNDLLWSIPEDWDLESAATVPVVYSTVLYALLKVTCVKPGTSILIHSATGGVGISALNVCIYHGCEIFMTVGTQEKRDFLRKNFPSIPNDHIGNSRDTSFEEMIKYKTNGRGVDIVLNSLTEEKLQASIRCLARGGTFLEIGKYDLVNNNLLSLLLFQKEISYHGIMLEKSFFESSEKKGWLVDEVNKGIKLGYVKPLPKTVFKRFQIEAAFRYMTTGKHIGKVLVNLREEEALKIAPPSKLLFKGTPRFNCDPSKCYIIIGGLGGFGLELADWLVLRGAKKIILVSRSGIKTGYQTQRIKIWESYNIVVQISKRDVTTKEGCLNLIKETTNLGAIDAIFNLAVVLKDGLFKDQSKETFATSLAPKAHATLYLDEVTRQFCPDLKYFVVFSSVSCGRGNVGQTNYGMANSVMERICEKRKREGFPATAIQWGAIGDVGLVAKMQKENRELVIGGTLQQRITSCLDVLDIFLNQSHPIVSSMVVAEKTDKNFDTNSAVEAVSFILGIKDWKTVNKDATLPELGMDSMTGTEVIQVLEKDFDIYLTSKDVRSLTFAKLAEIEAKESVGTDTTQCGRDTEILLKYLPENNTSASSLVNLPSRSQNGGTTILFPGIEGSLTTLAAVALNLNTKIFGVRYGDNSPLEIARRILPDIEENIEKSRTFNLVAYSFGALVALEVASLLEKKGLIGNVVIVEGAPTYLKNAISDYTQGETDLEIENSILMNLARIHLSISDKFMENQNILRNCKSLGESFDLLASRILPNFSETNLDKQSVIIFIKRITSAAAYSFAHEKIKSPVNLIRASFPMVANIESDFGLSEICERAVPVTELEGNHSTVLDHVEFANVLNKLLC